MKATTTRPRGSPAAAGSAVIRHCDKCLAVTAIDLDNTPTNAKALKMRGQTVRIVDTEEAKTMTLEKCKCGKGRWVTTHDGYTAPRWTPNAVRQARAAQGVDDSTD